MRRRRIELQRAESWDLRPSLEKRNVVDVVQKKKGFLVKEERKRLTQTEELCFGGEERKKKRGAKRWDGPGNLYWEDKRASANQMREKSFPSGGQQ